MQTLSKKGVLFLTSGFHQYYVFQNIAHLIEEQCDQIKQKALKIILSDGEIYISGVFKIRTFQQLDKCHKIKEFDLLRVLATYEGGTKPIFISFLQIFSQGHKGIYGLPPISLKDYMESRLMKSSNGFKQSPNQRKHNHVEDLKKDEIFIYQNQNGSHEAEKNNQILQQKIQKVVQAEKICQNEKNQLSFELSIQQNEYDLLKDFNQIQSKKRYQRVQNHEKIQNNPQKRHKPNEDQHQQGEMVLKQFQKLIEVNNKDGNTEKIQLQTSLQTTHKVQSLNSKDEQEVKKTKKILIKKHKEIEIIDLDDEPTQKQPVPYFEQSSRRQYRESHLKFIEEILQSQEKQTQKQTFSYKPQEQYNDQITIPRSQTLVQQNVTTPTKPPENDPIFNTSNQQMMGSTTQRKMLRQEYNLLIQNLYESNSSFKIICRVNYFYEWRSKNGTPCMALDLMDSIGDQIKAIVYMNHASRQCKQCGSMIEVGKIYCFQNGQCNRDLVEKGALQLVFNLRTKTCWNKEIPCGGRNKIIPASKIKIKPIFQNKIHSISQLIQNVQSGKNILTSVYGILQSFKFNQFEKKSNNNNENHLNEAQEDRTDPQIQFIDLQNPIKQKDKTSKKSNIKASNKQGPTNIYVNGFLADPIQRKKIGFACVIPKPINEKQIQTAQNFLIKNGIKKGALVILHNIKVQSTNNGTVHKLQKTKKTYMQVLTDRNTKWEYNRPQFASQTVPIKDIDEDTSLYPTLKQMLSFTQKEIDSIMENPRVVNYSKQPFTERSIFDLNQLLQKSMMPQQNCFSEIKGVKIHAIEQMPSVDICFYCKKKAKSAQQKSNSVSQAIKHCQRCKMIVKTITMHIFKIIFADDTASFLVEILKDDYLETLLGMNIQEYLAMQDHERKAHLELIKYTQFCIKLRSQKKMGSVIHKINSLEKMPIKARIEEIKQEKKGIPKHYQRLDSSW